MNKRYLPASIAGLALAGVVGAAAATAPAPASVHAAGLAPVDITPYVAPTIAVDQSTPIAADQPTSTATAATTAPEATTGVEQSTPLATAAPAATIGVYQSTPIATAAPAATIAPYHATLLTPYYATPLTPYHATIIKKVAPGATVMPFVAPPVTPYTSGSIPLYVATPAGPIPPDSDAPIGVDGVPYASYSFETQVFLAEQLFLHDVWTSDDGVAPAALSGSVAPAGLGGSAALMRAGGKSKKGKVLVYQTVVQVRADRHGHLLAHLRMGCHVRRPVPALITIVLHTPHGLVAARKSVTIRP